MVLSTIKRPSAVPTVPSSLASSSSSSAVPSGDVPIFLQKAYHMIDTCDTKICCWSDDGLTFIVKNTSLFETTIIPQFFKHNKFSSFVRQLNFYGFRKVKFSNTLRIDHKLEAATAKFWRFKHEHFRKGRKDLLKLIKRTPNSSTTSAVAASAAAAAARAAAARATTTSGATSLSTVSSSLSSSSALKNKSINTTTNANANNSNNNNSRQPEEVSHLKTEMQELKQRVASMTKNIDELTDLVKKVSVKDNAAATTTTNNNASNKKQGGLSTVVSPGASSKTAAMPDSVLSSSSSFGPGNKRKKMDSTSSVAVGIKREEDDNDAIMGDIPMMPDWNPSSSDLAGVDSLLLGDTPLLPDLPTSSSNTPSPIPSPAPSDDAFVDDLFQAFADEDAILPGLEGLEHEDEAGVANNPNKPDPQLMKRIEDSLSTIPRDMHEMVANKLIDAISNTQPIINAESVACSIGETSSSSATNLDRSISVDDTEGAMKPQAITMNDGEEGAGSSNNSNANTTTATAASPSSIPLPLAVATLKTILAEYGVSVECRRTPCSKDALDRSRFTKSLPVVPMHA